MTIVDILASFVAEANAFALPASEQDALRLHLADTVVAAVAGIRIPTFVEED